MTASFVLLPNILSSPPVPNPKVFSASCAINTYTPLLPNLVNGYPLAIHLLSKCTHLGVSAAGSPVTHVFKTFLSTLALSFFI